MKTIIAAVVAVLGFGSMAFAGGSHSDHYRGSGHTYHHSHHSHYVRPVPHCEPRYVPRYVPYCEPRYEYRPVQRYERRPVYGWTVHIDFSGHICRTWSVIRFEYVLVCD